MKQLSAEYLEWLNRQQRSARLNQCRQAGYLRQRQNKRMPAHPGRPLRREPAAIVIVPVRVLAERLQDREKLNDVVHTMLRVLGNSETAVKLDFRQTKTLYPGGTLILLAYLELLLERYPGRIKAWCLPHSMPAQLLRHFGIADRLGLDPKLSAPTHDSVVRWKYLTGTIADGESIATLIASYRQLTAAKIPDGLYEALTEALTNVRHHAYPKGSETPEPLRRWWLFAKYEEPTDSRPGNLFVGVYDIGVGIQASMRAQLQPHEKLLDMTGRWLDWAGIAGTSLLNRLLLQAAVERNRTSTGMANRGNGLPEMRDFVLGTPSGRLSIVSGSAQYTCSAKQPSSPATLSKAWILGTLIVWSIPLDPKEAPPCATT